jgi:hypothetical protein
MQSVKPDDVIGQAALLWRLIYGVVHALQGSNPDFIIVRHEDLARDAISGYRALYKALGLEFTSRVEKTILSSSSSENPRELSRKKVHAVKLDSRASVDNWKKRLTSEEIARVRWATEEISTRYYSDAEW